MKASELFDEYVDKIAVSSCTGFDSSEIDVLDKMTEKLRTAIAALEHENASLLTLQTEMQEYSNRHLRFSREQGEKILKLESDNAILERDHEAMVEAANGTNNELMERLADIEHQRWSAWMDYQCRNGSYGAWNRWMKKATIPYSQLSEQEKESDRVEVRKTLAAILAAKEAAK